MKLHLHWWSNPPEKSASPHPLSENISNIPEPMMEEWLLMVVSDPYYRMWERENGNDWVEIHTYSSHMVHVARMMVAEGELSKEDVEFFHGMKSLGHPDQFGSIHDWKAFPPYTLSQEVHKRILAAALKELEEQRGIPLTHGEKLEDIDGR